MTLRAMEISVLNPLHAPIGKVVLIAIMEDLIAAIVANRPAVEAPDDAFETELLLAQRREFLAWLHEQPGPNVNMALYPLPEEPLRFDGVLLH